jgi:hypothetical protein
MRVTSCDVEHGKILALKQAPHVPLPRQDHAVTQLLMQVLRPLCDDDLNVMI